MVKNTMGVVLFAFCAGVLAYAKCPYQKMMEDLARAQGGHANAGFSSNVNRPKPSAATLVPDAPRVFESAPAQSANAGIPQGAPPRVPAKQPLTAKFNLKGFNAEAFYAKADSEPEFKFDGGVRLGNQYKIVSGDVLLKNYVSLNVWEFDLRPMKFDKITGMSFSAPIAGSAQFGKIPREKGIFSIGIFNGVTGNAEKDVKEDRLSLLEKIDGLSAADIERGIDFSDLDINYAAKERIAVVLGIRENEVPMSSDFLRGPHFEADSADVKVSVSGTQIPEPADMAAIFGLLSLCLVFCKRRARGGR